MVVCAASKSESVATETATSQPIEWTIRCFRAREYSFGRGKPSIPGRSREDDLIRLPDTNCPGCGFFKVVTAVNLGEAIQIAMCSMEHHEHFRRKFKKGEDDYCAGVLFGQSLRPFPEWFKEGWGKTGYPGTPEGGME